MPRPLGLSSAALLLAIAGLPPAAGAARVGDSQVLAEGGPAPAFELNGAVRRTPGTSRGGSFLIAGAAHWTAEPGLVFGDDFESGDLTAWAPPYGMPSGTVAFFESSACPSGWTPLEAARGRALVGRPAGGTIGGTWGTALADLAPPRHAHFFSPGTVTLSSQPNHRHWWSILWPDLEWTSYNAPYSVITVYQWDNGIDAEGEGYFPFAAQPDTTLATDSTGGHSHGAPFGLFGTGLSDSRGVLPYLQLLVCRKS